MVAYEDLLKDSSESFEDNNYFIVTIEELEPGSIYPLQFRWKYKDGSYGKDWSATYTLVTESEQVPGAPGVTANGDTPGMITITWDGENVQGANIEEKIKQVDIYISGSPFDGSKPAINFDKAGTKTVTAPAGVYTIVAYALTALGTVSTQTTIASVTVTGISAPVTAPETPDAPVVKAGLASVIVEWNGKKTGGGDLTTTGFAGAKVYIGTSAGFTPSDNNWVHTLNFANGSNRVSIGVGSVIDKALGTTLQYGTPYYIKLDTINANGTSNNSPVAASGNPITVSKLPASEISTGILSADASITAGVSGGSRVVMSGGPSPFVIYGTDGTTKLLEFIGGATGTLSITGSGKFTGDLEAGSGSSVFKSDSNGIYLGNAVFASAPFSVSRSGVIKAESGTIGGLTLASNAISNSAGTFKIGSTGQLLLGSESGTNKNLLITPSQIVHRTGSTASGNFTLDITTGTLTIGGYATTGDLATKVGASDVVNHIGGLNTTTISGGVITTGTINANSVSILSGTAGQARLEITSSGLKAYKSVGSPATYQETVSIGSDGNASFTGTITATSGTFSGTVNASGGTFSGNITASGTISGGTISGATISGSTITTTGGNTDGSVRLSNANDALELMYSGSAIGALYSYNSGTEVLLQRGSPTALGIRYPISTGYLSLSSSGVAIGRAGASGTLSTGFNIDGGSTSITALVGSNGFIVSGGFIYTGTNTSSVTDASEGVSISQGGTINARRNNNQPLNLHVFSVTAGATTSVPIVNFYRNSTLRGTLEIFGNTSAPVLVGSSDYRLKENIRDYSGGLNKILAAKVRVFNEIEDPLHNDIVGFVAHEFAEIFPDFVNGEKDAVDEDGNPIYQRLSYSNIIPYLVEAIQTLSKRLDALEG